MKQFNAREITPWDESEKQTNGALVKYLLYHSKDITDGKASVNSDNSGSEREIKLHSIFTAEVPKARNNNFGVRSYQDYLSSYNQLIEKIELLIEEKVAERTIELKEANDDLDSFAYSVSHDLRAPLQVIKSYSSILSNKYRSSLDENAKNLLDGITAYSKNMSLIMDNLLNLSRLGKTVLSKTEVNMHKLVQEVITELAPVSEHAAAKVNLINLNQAHCDAGLIKQVWINLISNSIKYSTGGKPTLIEIGCTEENGKSIYYIKDNGVGFNMKYADKLFGLFSRLHNSSEFEGTGVGLNIVYRIISKHGGKIWATAKENEGATFYFTLS